MQHWTPPSARLTCGWRRSLRSAIRSLPGPHGRKLEPVVAQRRTDQADAQAAHDAASTQAQPTGPALQSAEDRLTAAGAQRQVRDARNDVDQLAAALADLDALSGIDQLDKGAAAAAADASLARAVQIRHHRQGLWLQRRAAAERRDSALRAYEQLVEDIAKIGDEMTNWLTEEHTNWLADTVDEFRQALALIENTVDDPRSHRADPAETRAADVAAATRNLHTSRTDMDWVDSHRAVPDVAATASAGRRRRCTGDAQGGGTSGGRAVKPIGGWSPDGEAPDTWYDDIVEWRQRQTDAATAQQNARDTWQTASDRRAQIRQWRDRLDYSLTAAGRSLNDLGAQLKRLRSIESRLGIADLLLREASVAADVTAAAALSGPAVGVPVVLLPIRLETSWHERTLRVRVFPDRSSGNTRTLSVRSCQDVSSRIGSGTTGTPTAGPDSAAAVTSAATDASRQRRRSAIPSRDSIEPQPLQLRAQVVRPGRRQWSNPAGHATAGLCRRQSALAVCQVSRAFCCAVVRRSAADAIRRCRHTRCQVLHHPGDEQADALQLFYRRRCLRLERRRVHRRRRPADARWWPRRPHGARWLVDPCHLVRLQVACCSRDIRRSRLGRVGPVGPRSRPPCFRSREGLSNPSTVSASQLVCSSVSQFVISSPILAMSSTSCS